MQVIDAVHALADSMHWRIAQSTAAVRVLLRRHGKTWVSSMMPPNLHPADAGGMVRQLAAWRRGALPHGGQNGAPPLPRLAQRLLHDLQRDALHLHTNTCHSVNA
jgi:hypothetical protein